MSLISSWRAVIIAIVVASGALATAAGATARGGDRAVLDDDASWLSVVNHHRLAAGLAPVEHEPAWLPGLEAHLTYLRDTPTRLRTGAYASSHTQNPASPWASADGEEAGRSSNRADRAGRRPRTAPVPPTPALR
ncbi:MAG: hypothetical protein AAFZ07_24315 [Actinomycetota bacterium]